MRRQTLAKLHGQRTLAETCGGADQQQPSTESCLQALAKAWSQYVSVRQRRAKKTPVQCRDGNACGTRKWGQISHGRLLFELLLAALQMSAD
jgi:hypothetical protein